MKKLFDGLKDWATQHPWIAGGIVLFFVIAIVGSYTTR